MNAVTSAIEHIGLSKLGREFGYRPSAIQKWRDEGRLPQSELAGLTNYAETIERITQGKFKASSMLEETRKFWECNAAIVKRRA